MIRGGFLSAEDRSRLIALARDGSAASRITRRANALVLLDDGWSCQEVAAAFLLNDDTIRLLAAIEALYPLLALIHVFLDNARYHHAKLVQEWLARPDCRIKLHFIPTYCPHLNPIERLWGLMHRNVTHNKCYATYVQFAEATLSFLRENVPRNWTKFCDSVTDNFRVIKPRA
jgi:hypothetical protein